MGARVPSASGKVTITIDFRSSESGQSAWFADLEGVIALVSVLRQLAGTASRPEIFFDFGKITISEFDLEALRKRML